MKEYVIWGTRNGEEKVVRVNGEEVQTDLETAKHIVAVLKKRGEFENLRILTIDFSQPLEKTWTNPNLFNSLSSRPNKRRENKNDRTTA